MIRLARKEPALRAAALWSLLSLSLVAEVSPELNPGFNAKIAHHGIEASTKVDGVTPDYQHVHRFNAALGE